MRVQIQNGGSYLRLALGAAILCLLCTPNWAAEFGEVHVVSYIGQPLVVEVELTALSNDEATALQVRPSGPDVFRGANIQMNPVLASMHWVIRHRDKHQFLRITTDKPVHASFLNMFFELGSKNERSVRALTVWLEPRPEPVQNDGVATSALPGVPQPVATSVLTEETKPDREPVHALAVPLAGRGRDCSASQQRCVAVDRENRAIRSQIQSLEKELIVLNQAILGSAKVAVPAARKPPGAPALTDTNASPDANQDSASAITSASDDSELFLKKEEETILPAKKPEPKAWPWKLIAIGAGAGLLLLALAAWLYRKRRAKAKKPAKPGESAQAPAMEGVVAEDEPGDDAARAAAHPPKWWKKWRYALTARWKSLMKPRSGESAGSDEPDPKPGFKARLSGLWGKLTKKSAPAPILEPD